MARTPIVNETVEIGAGREADCYSLEKAAKNVEVP
jgi:hypothetical protein